MRNAIRLICVLLLFIETTAGAARIKRVAVLEFENAGPDKNLDWIGTWLAEEFTQEAKRAPALTVIDRGSLDAILREFQLARSQYIVPGTAKQMGRMLGADSLITGKYQVIDGVAALAAHVTDVETGAVLVTARIEGPFSNLSRLQSELARNLLSEILGAPLNLEAFPDRNTDAYHALSDGIYFLRTGLLNYALEQFDRALTIEKNYPEAEYYRGLVFSRLEKWSDAVAAFKRALPGVTPARRVAWHWEAPFAPGATHGHIYGIDAVEARADPVKMQKRILFGERTANGTRLYIPDLDHRRVRQIELPDANIILNTLAAATDTYTMLTSADNLPRPKKVGLYAISAADSLWWRAEFPVKDGQPPMIGVTPDSVYLYSKPEGTLTFFDARTGRLQWSRRDIALDPITVPILHGKNIIMKTVTDYRAISLADGSDAWVFTPQTPSTSDIENGRLLAIFEHGAASPTRSGVATHPLLTGTG